MAAIIKSPHINIRLTSSYLTADYLSNDCLSVDFLNADCLTAKLICFFERGRSLNKEDIAKLLKDIAGSDKIKIDEPMSSHTSFKIGGKADIMVLPDDEKSLAEIINFLRDSNIPLYVMGNGTNLIVRDKGIRGVVVKIRDGLSAYGLDGERITAQSGMLLSGLSRIAMENGLSGLEFAEGIPGTLGGAVAMNAGAYDGDMSMVVEKSEYLCQDGKITTLSNKQHLFGKRSSFVQSDGGVVLKTCLKLIRRDRELIKQKMEKFREMRSQKQPLDMPSAGSVFKRPEGHFAGKLIQDCGLKGYSAGGAIVSDLHCGFIINKGNATASDVISLIETVQEKVFNKFGVRLQTEVKIIGEK